MIETFRTDTVHEEEASERHEVLHEANSIPNQNLGSSLPPTIFNQLVTDFETVTLIRALVMASATSSLAGITEARLAGSTIRTRNFKPRALQIALHDLVSSANALLTLIPAPLE